MSIAEAPMPPACAATIAPPGVPATRTRVNPPATGPVTTCTGPVYGTPAGDSGRA